MMIRSFLALLAVLVLGSGCSTTITNLTPSRMTRNANGLYPFEVALDSNQQSLRKETIQPYVLIGLDSYPMQPTPMLNNRWETLIEIPAGRQFLEYRYKFDYQYNSFHQPRSSSKLSPPYQLQLVDP
jgi:hypothetical protein